MYMDAVDARCRAFERHVRLQRTFQELLGDDSRRLRTRWVSYAAVYSMRRNARGADLLLKRRLDDATRSYQYHRSTADVIPQHIKMRSIIDDMLHPRDLRSSDRLRLQPK